MDTLRDIRKTVEINRRARNLREAAVIWLAVAALVIVAAWSLVA